MKIWQSVAFAVKKREMSRDHCSTPPLTFLTLVFITQLLLKADGMYTNQRWMLTFTRQRGQWGLDPSRLIFSALIKWKQAGFPFTIHRWSFSRSLQPLFPRQRHSQNSFGSHYCSRPKGQPQISQQGPDHNHNRAWKQSQVAFMKHADWSLSLSRVLRCSTLVLTGQNLSLDSKHFNIRLQYITAQWDERCKK